MQPRTINALVLAGLLLAAPLASAQDDDHEAHHPDDPEALEGPSMPEGMMGQGMMEMMPPEMMQMMMRMMRPGMMGQGTAEEHVMRPGMMGQMRMGMPGGDPLLYGSPHGTPEEMTPERVRELLEQRLEYHGNPRLTLGEISEAEDGSITAEILTTDGSLVQKLAFNRYPGLVRQLAD